MDRNSEKLIFLRPTPHRAPPPARISLSRMRGFTLFRGKEGSGRRVKRREIRIYTRRGVSEVALDGSTRSTLLHSSTTTTTTRVLRAVENAGVAASRRRDLAPASTG